MPRLDNYDKLVRRAKLRAARKPRRPAFVRADVPAGPSLPEPPSSQIIGTNVATFLSAAEGSAQRWSGDATTATIYYLPGCPPPWPPAGATFVSVLPSGASPAYTFPLQPYKFFYCLFGQSSTYRVQVAFLKFDTSSLPDTAIITDATLRVFGGAPFNDNDRSVVFSWAAYTEPSGAASDWTANVSGDAHPGIPLTDLPGYVTRDSTGVYALHSDPIDWFEIPLQNAAANVSKTGSTYLKMGISGDAPEVAVEGNRVVAAYNQVTFKGRGAVYEEKPVDPQLVVRYA